MTRKELIEYCLTYPDAIEDYPFEDRKNTAMRHAGNRKWFALIFEANGKLCVNLKCEPMRADLLRQVYQGVTSAWHMNKAHWNTVTIGSDVPQQELFDMIQHSYSLTLQKK